MALQKKTRVKFRTHFLVWPGGTQWWQRWPSFLCQVGPGSDWGGAAALFSQRTPASQNKKIHVISDRTKSKRPGSKQNSFQSCNTPSSPTHLGVVKVREALSSEAFGQLALDDHILYLMSQQFVVDVTRHWSLIHSKCLQSTLHPEKKNIFLTKHCYCNWYRTLSFRSLLH